MDIANSLAHTKWKCKYHIVFCTKVTKTGDIQRRKGRCRTDIGNIMP